MGKLSLTASLVFVTALAACGAAEDPTMPDVVGENLDVALSDIEHAGIDDDVEVVGGGMFGVVDESNWQVCEQIPLAGGAVADAPRLTVDRSCSAETQSRVDDDTAETPMVDGEVNSADGTDEAAPSTTEEATTGPDATEAAPAPLTVQNNGDLARIMTLTDTCSQEIVDFVEQYGGQSIEFDGSIVAMNNHGSYDTRYDILINAGEYSETVAAPGPSFQYRDVNTTSDLHYTSDDVPDTIGVGDALHIVAEIADFETSSCLLLLEPVSTTFESDV